MGCSCSREEAKVIVSQQVQNKNKFLIKILLPKSERIKILYYEAPMDHMSIIELFNSLFFCSQWAEEVDANFVSNYNSDKDQFDYKIQRLVGYEFDEEEPERSQVWSVYINEKMESPSNLFGENRIVNKTDVIELKYEFII